MCKDKESALLMHNSGVLGSIQIACENKENIELKILEEIYTFLAQMTACEEASSYIGENFTMMIN